MKQKHMIVIGALTLCGSLMVAVPSSFAVKSMDDKEMDQITAAGQSRIDIGDGDQYINDGSVYTVTIDGQAAVSGGSIVNVAGENNVAVGVNVVNADLSDTVDQENTVSQQRNAQVTITGPAGLAWETGVTVLNANTPADGSEDNATIEGGITVDNITASADHIKIGQGNQTEVDSSTYTVEIDADAQAVVTALSLVNAAGRNNVAVGVNAANSDQSIGVGGGAAGLTSYTLSTITQYNTFIQQN